jgi:hypothetical protein
LITAFFAACFAALLADLGHVLAILRYFLAAFTANFGHVLPILAYGFATLPARFRVPFRVAVPSAAFAALIAAAATL